MNSCVNNLHFSVKSLSRYKLMKSFSTINCNYQKKNHYDCLGITPNATQKDVKTAYYKLSKQYHPDMNRNNPSAATKFRDVSEAYEILGNVKSRKLYDRGVALRGNYPTEDYTSKEQEEPVDEYKHAPFYHSRNQPSSSRTQKGKTVKYDMDEWTRAHYSETFAHQQTRKNESQTFTKEKYQTREETSHILSTLSMVLFGLVGILVFSINPSRGTYDVPSLKSDKRDE